MEGRSDFGPIRFDNNNNTKEDELMKRFLGVLVAAMFLASAAYVGAAAKDDKGKTEKTEATEKSKVKKTDGKAKAAKTKGGAMADDKAGDKKAGAMADDKKSK
jgi:hypothetical protein